MNRMFSRCAFSLLPVALLSAGHHGIVKFGPLPVPGATVTATSDDTRFSTITDFQGAYAFPNLPDGTWKIAVQMSGFSPGEKEIVAPDTAALEWELDILPLEQMNAQVLGVTSDAEPPPALKSAIESGDAADGFLINGSANNSAASPFSQASAFGNNRRNSGSLYTGNLGVILGNSVFDARPFSLTGQDTPKPDYNQIQGLLSFGGPLRIPRILRRNGPDVTLNYQWLQNSNVSTQAARVPTLAERSGDFAGWPVEVIDPATGLPFPDKMVPSGRISPQARSLLTLYPLPNAAGNSRYNFQAPIAGDTHQDNLQSRFHQRLPHRNQLLGNFAYSSTRTDSPNLFAFLDKTNTTGLNTGLSWMHMFNPRLYTVLGYQFSRLSTRVAPFFAYRRNVSGEAGIEGNNQEPVNWGPPALSFASGIAALGDAQSSQTRNQTSGVSFDAGWSRGRHNLAVGGLYRRQQFNLLAQQDPRGSLAFTGASSGSDFAGFLVGIADTSSIAFGNADKYFRASSSAVYITDDLRLRPGLTLNFGIRWEYNSPIAERYGRLVNLDIDPGFAAATPVVGPRLLYPDRNNFAPRVGFAWRPFSASSTVLRGGYGVYYDTSLYLAIATQMAQQSPLSTSLRVENSAANPLTLANPFPTDSATGRNTYAVDPHLRTGYSQNWQLSVQRDLPASLAMIVSYAASKGTRAQQQFLPNTFPLGASNPCPDCPSGFTFLTSNGNSIRHAGQVEVRRRLRSGFTATLQYTFANSIDNAALGGRTSEAAERGAVLIAQNWLDLHAERARSNFDQRHLVSAEAQFTTGMGLAGGTLVDGWKGRLFKDWTLSTTLTAGTGLPLTPVYFAAVQGTGVTGTIRPDYTGAPLYDAPGGSALNRAAYSAPATGRWGNAGRNSITGPAQFTLDSSLSRTFRVSDRLNTDFRIDAFNVLNHPVFPSWNTVVTSAQFGLPDPARPMRSLRMTARLTF